MSMKTVTAANNEKTVSTYALAAKMIRAELKKAFPGIKFSVKSEGYSGGSSVRASWTDGPTRDQVESIIGKYEYGHFDGMTDSYNYSNVREDLPQVRFVFAEREWSEETKNWCMAVASELGWNENNSSHVEAAYRIFCQRSECCSSYWEPKAV